MIRDVLHRGDYRLEIPCAVVKKVSDAGKIVQDLRDTIAHLKTKQAYRRGIGLAAPQIGEQWRISVVENTAGEQFELINPKIIDHATEKQPIREGCISFLQYRAMVPRYPFVRVRALNLQGDTYELEGEGDFAMLLQHELDHLDGILYVEHLPQGEAELVQVNE